MQLTEIDAYFTDKLRQHGPRAAGVDWNGEASQRTRFAQLAKLFDGAGAFSLNDLGCGYGALVDYLTEQGKKPDYLGIDISRAMIEQASKLHGAKGCRFIAGDRPDRTADYTVASGIFNMRLAIPDDAWKAHIAATLDAMRDASTKGFAFNCLTSYSDPPRMRPDLYYANPGEWFDFCKRRYSRNVALLHDYDLYEFTMIVRLGSP